MASADHDAGGPGQATCLVIPCYNEAHRLRRDDMLAFVQGTTGITLCFVDDGSSDGTGAMLEAMRGCDPQRMMVLTLPRNQGKAEAVRQGVLHAASLRRHAIIGYWDADLSTPLTEVERLRARLAASTAIRLVMGARVKRLGALIERQPLRHVLGRVFATCASWLLDLPVYDSQCGAKLFRAEVAGLAFASPFTTTWLFDLEMLARLRNAVGMRELLASVVEVPLERWTEVGGSKLRAADFLRAPLQLFRIHARYNAGLLSRSPGEAS